MSKKSQEKYRSLGLCILCGKQPPRDNRQTCDHCAERARMKAKRRSDKRITGGLCCVCGVNPLVTKRHCNECYMKHKVSSKKNHLLLKEKIFRAYGGYVCACCGEKEKAFLTIDHINNDGAAHRREVGSALYKWLEMNEFPEAFQVLCMNCQWGKRVNGGVCPHKQKDQEDGCS